MPGVAASKQASELLKRVAAADLADRFELRDVAGVRPMRFLKPLESLVDDGHVQQVREGVGRWYYRLTDAGRAEAVELLKSGAKKVAVQSAVPPVKSKLPRQSRAILNMKRRSQKK